MTAVITEGDATVYHGSCLDVLPTLADNSIDAVVTDPPYELGFMGKSWDASGIAFNADVWRECLRVLKPGGHLLAFGGTRTFHRIAVAIEDAGFEVRDSIAWLYGSGFPKSLDVAKSIDAKLTNGNAKDISGAGLEPETEEARKWKGWGTALKPAFEPIIVARKPPRGTIAENVLEYGTGGLNIDATRIGSGTGQVRTYQVTDIRGGNYGQDKEAYSERGKLTYTRVDQGRWPANVMLDEYAADILDDQTLLIGGTSVFFYTSKASKKDRNEGLRHLPEKKSDERSDKDAGLWVKMSAKNNNFHPTVKPTDLMRQLVKLVTPPGGVVLDPFTGSGSTGKAAILEGAKFVGIELTEEYLPIIQGRLAHANALVAMLAAQAEKQEKERLF